MPKNCASKKASKIFGSKAVHKMLGEIDFRLSPTDLLQLPLKEMDLNLSLESLSKVFNP